MPTKKKVTTQKIIKKNVKKPATKKVGFTPAIFDDHVDIMKMIYGSCGACPSSSMCGSADEAPAKLKKAKGASKKLKNLK